VTWLGVALGGAVGSAARYAASQAINRWVGPKAAWAATFVVNVLGSFLLGWGAGLWAATAGWHGWHVMVSVGVLGGFTTFSAASLEAATLATGPADARTGGTRRPLLGRLAVALAHTAAMAALSIGAAALGLALA
jgi:CrcB protein